jgi:phospholipid transport system substrate-binding protein
MHFQKTEPGSDGFKTSLDHAAVGLAPSATSGLPRGVSEALADPIVKALMAADRVDPQSFEELVQRIAAGLARRDLQNRSVLSTRRENPTVGTGLAKLAKGFVLAAAVIAGLSAAPRSAAADDTPVGFIRALGTQAVSVIRSDMPLSNKAYYFHQMVRQDFDVTGICLFVLGRYWRVASPAERQEFCDGFADRLVRFYGRQLAQSGNGDFVVTGSRTSPDGVIVSSRIIRPQDAPIAVDWRLGVSEGVYKVEDIAIDGISMALAQRSEIAGSAKASTRSRTSPSTASAWRWPSVPKSRGSSRAAAGRSRCCSRRCAQRVETAVNRRRHADTRRERTPPYARHAARSRHAAR